VERRRRHAGTHSSRRGCMQTDSRTHSGSLQPLRRSSTLSRPSRSMSGLSSPPFTSISTSSPGASETSFPKSKIKVLLLERISQAAINIFVNEGFQVEAIDKSISEDVLLEKIASVHAIGIRSKTVLNEKVLKAAKKLITIGCLSVPPSPRSTMRILEYLIWRL
jgi:hypothetical protein